MFDGYIRDFAIWTPGATAVLTPAGAVTFARFDADIDRCGAALAELGVRPGCGVVCLAVGQAYLGYVTLAALARLGVPASPSADAAADLCLTDHPDPPERRGLIRLTPDWTAAMFAAEPRPLPVLDLDLDSLGRVMLSSGTTGQPHRIPLSWRRLETRALSNLRVYGAGRIGTWFPMTGVDSLLGFSHVMLAWAVGGAVAGGLDIPALPRWLETLPEGVVGMTPIQLASLLDALPPAFHNKPAWRLVIGGSVLPPAVAREAALRITPDIRNVYGATEANQMGAGSVADILDEPGCAGVTQAGMILEVIDDGGRPLPDGESGEIRVRGPRVAEGYIDDPRATAERFRDGWYYTRDIGRRLPAGHPRAGRVVVEGRADDRMNLGGRKFLPSALEGPALQCPGVLDAAAFAVPDAQGVDQCWLAVVTVPGFEREALARHLAGWPDLPPNRFAWAEEIPRNAMGKVERQTLRDAVIAATRPAPSDASGG